MIKEKLISSYATFTTQALFVTHLFHKRRTKTVLLVICALLLVGSIYVFLNTTGIQDSEASIAFISKRGLTAHIYLMRADGSHQTQLTFTKYYPVYWWPFGYEGYDMSPMLASQGQHIVFLSNGSPEGKYVFYSMQRDGSGLSRLPYPIQDNVNVALSPDGLHIAFIRDQQLYSMRSDGSQQRQLTTDPDIAYTPAWSPNGQQLAFASKRDGDFAIYIINLIDEHRSRLTNIPGENNDMPSWSPDGKHIAFRSDRSGGDIYKMNSDGSEQVQLTHSPATELDPSWSLDGQQIAFVSLRDGNPEIYTMRADGSDQRRLTNDPALDRQPIWIR